MLEELKKYLGKRVILDSHSSWVYIGTLEGVTDNCAILTDTNAFDSKDSSTTKEVYIFQTRTTGIKSNRKSVHVCLDYVISFSLLEDVIEF